MKKSAKFFYAWLPSLLWSGVIFLASSFPLAVKAPVKIPFLDKVLHLIIYAPLGFFTARAFRMSGTESVRKNFAVLTLIFCVLYGLIDEFHQLFVANRTSSLWDVLFDIAGSGTGLIIFKIFKKGVWENAGYKSL